MSRILNRVSGARLAGHSLAYWAVSLGGTLAAYAVGGFFVVEAPLYGWRGLAAVLVLGVLGLARFLLGWAVSLLDFSEENPVEGRQAILGCCAITALVMVAAKLEGSPGVALLAAACVAAGVVTVAEATWRAGDWFAARFPL